MTAQELLDDLLWAKEKYGTLDVEIDVFLDGDRFNIDGVDIFEDGVDRHLSSMDLNTSKL